jgi:NADH-quinone oxidoreductase subunit J
MLDFLLAQAAPLAANPASGGQVPVISPVAILSLCVLGAVGVGLLLPADRSALLRRAGGALLLVGGLIFGLLILRHVQHLTLPGETGAYFWAFSAIAIVSAIRVITHPRPVYSALYFVLTVFASAGLFVLLWAQFMAAALVLIYAGAVLVTYVFVIMLAAESSAAGSGERNTATAGIAEVDRVSRDPFLAGAIGFTLLGVLLMVVFDTASAVEPVASNSSPSAAMLADATEDPGVAQGLLPKSPIVPGDTQELGAFLYQKHLVSVQIAMLLLTLAMTGAVVIARRRIVTADEVATVAKITPEPVTGPATPTDDNPHTIPVYGTEDPRAKEYPQT